MYRTDEKASLLCNQHGLSLIEILVAMMILALFLTPALTGFILAETETQRCRDVIAATDIATKTIEDYKDLASVNFYSSALGGRPGLDDYKKVELTPAASDDPRYVVKAHVTQWAKAPDNVSMYGVKEITVEVYRSNDQDDPIGAALCKVSQWITQGGP